MPPLIHRTINFSRQHGAESLSRPAGVADDTYLLLGNHGKYDVCNLSGQPLPLVFILFVTLLEHKDKHLQHLQRQGKANIRWSQLWNKTAWHYPLHLENVVPDGIAQVSVAWTPPPLSVYPALCLHLLYLSPSTQTDRERLAAGPGWLSRNKCKNYFNTCLLSSLWVEHPSWAGSYNEDELLWKDGTALWSSPF